MTAECSWMAKKAGLGVTTSVSVGGDPLIGMPPRDVLAMFEDDPDTQAVLLWGEPGTRHEEDVATLIEARGFTKPVVAYVAGSFVEGMPEGTVFGHAASIIEGNVGRPSTKRARLKEAGARVAEQFDDIIPLLQDAV
jgi:succinyl-CoA synthetase alpha subunit